MPSWCDAISGGTGVFSNTTILPFFGSGWEQDCQLLEVAVLYTHLQPCRGLLQRFSLIHKEDFSENLQHSSDCKEG